ncbi:Orf2 [Seal anellovirus TFFN/USA/2006]|uniref:Orf2 n=1 Tax=Seal anellovirus TFFN/USA/2006 TaxID=991022 RepID=F1CHU4_9VIRU|nr:Orf2 [Seal anellovirus TFFN/USA/2006]ADZ04932.1 ORF2 [Seal anellovirus TFFN/USA/2006]
MGDALGAGAGAGGLGPDQGAYRAVRPVQQDGQDWRNLFEKFAVCFDLIYETTHLSGMENQPLNGRREVIYVKLVSGWWEFFMICLHIIVQGIILIYVILNFLNLKKHTGKD